MASDKTLYLFYLQYFSNRLTKFENRTQKNFKMKSNVYVQETGNLLRVGFVLNEFTGKTENDLIGISCVIKLILTFSHLESKSISTG